MSKFVSNCFQVIVLLLFMFLFWRALWPLCEYMSAKMLEGHKADVAREVKQRVTADKLLSGETVTLKELDHAGLIRININMLSDATVAWYKSKGYIIPEASTPQNKSPAFRQYEELLNYKIQLTPLPPTTNPTPVTP